MKKTKKKKQIGKNLLYSINADLDLIGFDFSVWKVILFLLGFVAGVPCFILMLEEKIKLALYFFAFVLLMVYPILNIIDNVRRERFLCDAEFIVLSAAISMGIKEYKAALIILFGYSALKLLECYFTDKQRIRLGTIVDLIPEDTLTIVDGELVHKKPSRIRKGDYIGVNSNSVIPVDGIVVNGSSKVDYSSVSHSEYLIPIVKGSKVYSGGMNCDEPIILQADCDYSSCFIQKLLTACQNAIEKKFNDKICLSVGIAVPVIFLIAFIVGVVAPIFNHAWAQNARFCVYLLLLCCPYGIFSALSLNHYIAVLSFFSNGVIISDCETVDKLAKAGTLICNKTGTLTESLFTIEDVKPEGISMSNFLSMILNVESSSNNPMANALRYFCGVISPEKPDNLTIEEIRGNGIVAKIDGNRILVGNSKLLFDFGIFARSPEKPGSVVHVAVNDQYCGYVLFSNKLRDTTANSMETIKATGMRNLVLLSGDLQPYVRSMASSLGFNVVKAEIDRREKTSVADYLMDNRAGDKTVVYVGNRREEMISASHTDVSVTTDMIEEMDSIGGADMDILSGGISSFAKVYSVSLKALLSSRIIMIAYLIIKPLLLILSLTSVLPVWLLSGIMSFTMCAMLITIIIRLGKDE